MNNPLPPAQASDEQAALSKQLTTWRAEVARLNDLIAHASGVQASDEPMLPRPACTYADHSYPAFNKRQMIEYGEQRYQAGLAAMPRATADVEQDAERWRFRKEFLKNEGAIVWTLTRCRLRSNGELVSEGANEEAAIDAAIAATKGAKP